jgi:hypothetical protein
MDEIVCIACGKRLLAGQQVHIGFKNTDLDFCVGCWEAIPHRDNKTRLYNYLYQFFIKQRLGSKSISVELPMPMPTFMRRCNKCSYLSFFCYYLTPSNNLRVCLCERCCKGLLMVKNPIKWLDKAYSRYLLKELG